MKHKQRKRIPALYAVLAALLLLCACGGNGSQGEGSIAQASGTEMQNSAVLVGDAWDEENAVEIALNGDSIEIGGAGAKAAGNILTVTDAGTYVLRGELTGQVVISASNNDTVRLVLAGVDITASENAAIYAKQCDQLIITLAEGTENALNDAADFAYSDFQAEEPDAALFSKVDLVINGAGSLQVTADFYNGIGSKDDLVVENGNISIAAAHNGIRGRDSLQITGGSFVINAGNDGLQSNNDSGEDKGWIRIADGSFSITAARDGIQAETTLEITGGSFDVVCGGGGENTDISSEESYKGLKASGNLLIGGGTFTIDSADDAVHSNSNITVSGGELILSTGDDGVHADGHLEITGGAIHILRSYEGLEGSTMSIADGVIGIAAQDDGINVAGGNDSAMAPGRFGADTFAAGANGERWLKITGGSIEVDAAGDGLDSNGIIEMSGGTVLVHGPAGSANGAIDYEGSFTITGGTLIAAGSSGMAQAPGGNSTQPSLSLYFSAQQQGSTVALLNAGGDEIASYTPSKNFQHIVISAPGMKEGETYTVTVNGAELVQVTLSGTVTSISDTGETVSGGTMGGGFGGGRRGDGGLPPDGTLPDRTAPPGGIRPGV